MQNAFCFPKCTMELEKRNWSKCYIHLTRGLHREQVFRESLLIFKLLAPFAPKRILNHTSRNTLHTCSSSLNYPPTHKHTHTSSSFSLPPSFPSQMKHLNPFVIVVFIENNYKESKATCWENISVNIQTLESILTPHRRLAYKRNLCVLNPAHLWVDHSE